MVTKLKELLQTYLTSLTQPFKGRFYLQLLAVTQFQHNCNCLLWYKGVPFPLHSISFTCFIDYYKLLSVGAYKGHSFT